MVQQFADSLLEPEGGKFAILTRKVGSWSEDGELFDDASVAMLAIEPGREEREG